MARGYCAFFDGYFEKEDGWEDSSRKKKKKLAENTQRGFCQTQTRLLEEFD